MAIDFSNIVSSDSGITANGIVSGLDTQGLVDAIVSIEELKVTGYQDSIEGNDATISAYGDLRSILGSLRSSVDLLRDPPGVSNASSNIFEYRTSSLSISDANKEVGNFLSVVASPGASVSDYTIAIDSLAEAKQERTDGFGSRTASVTEAASGTTAGLFSAGDVTFVTSQTLTAGASVVSYTQFGNAANVLVSSTAFSNLVSGSDPYVMQGAFDSVSATVDGGNLDIQITLDNGEVYVANNVPADQGGSSDSILAGAYTFTNAVDGSSFDLNLASDYVIGGVQGNADNFATQVLAEMSGVSLAQARQLTNLDVNEFEGTILEGLTSSGIVYTADNYQANADIGAIQNFSVTGVSGAGNGDASITVIINGETFQATGLGNAQDQIDTNITLESTTTNKTLDLNIGDAGIALDLDEEGAALLQSVLNSASPAKVATVTIEAGDSLIDIAAAINAQSASSGVTANILAVSGSDYRLSLQSTETGTENAYSIVDTTGAFSQVNFNTVQAAQDAVLSVDGVEVTRSTNRVSDVISNVTLNLLAVTEDYGLVTQDDISLSIDRDVDTVATGIINFLDSYNDFRVFNSQQTERDDGGDYLESAVLQNDSILRTLSSRLYGEIASVVSNTQSASFNDLSDIGVSFTDFAGDEETPATNNIMTVDTAALEAALVSNYDELRQIFEFTFTANSSDIAVSSRTNETTLSNFQLDIDLDADEGEEVRVLNESGAFLFYMNLTQIGSGTYRISGKEDTGLEGLRLLYTGSGDETINVDISYGIADRMYNYLDDILDEDNGALQLEIDLLEEANTDLEDNIADLELEIEDERSRLRTQFAAMEAAITRVNTLLAYLEAQVAVNTTDR